MSEALARATHARKLIVDRLQLSRRKQGKSRLMLIVSACFVGVEPDPK